MSARKARVALTGQHSQAEVLRMRRACYAQLRAEGFVDIEYESSTWLKVTARANRGGLRSEEYEATLEYYSRAGAMLHHYPWDDSVDRDVWRRHADGRSLREIAKARRWSVRRAFAVVRRLRAQLATWWPVHQEATAPDDDLPTIARERAALAAARLGDGRHWRPALATRGR